MLLQAHVSPWRNSVYSSLDTEAAQQQLKHVWGVELARIQNSELQCVRQQWKLSDHHKRTKILQLRKQSHQTDGHVSTNTAAVTRFRHWQLLAHRGLHWSRQKREEMYQPNSPQSIYDCVSVLWRGISSLCVSIALKAVLEKVWLKSVFPILDCTVYYLSKALVRLHLTSLVKRRKMSAFFKIHFLNKVGTLIQKLSYYLKTTRPYD